MIEFELLDTTVKIVVNTGTGHSISTKYECDNTLYARLLYDKLRQRQWDLTEAFAKKNYEEGFDDKKKRKAKRDWHPSKI